MTDRNTKLRSSQLKNAEILPEDLSATNSPSSGDSAKYNLATGKFEWGVPVALFSDGTVNPTNLLSNGNFEIWSNGISAAPDAWALAGAGATIAKETTIKKIASSSVKLTRVGTNCNLGGEIISAYGINYWKGRLVTFSCWVYATTVGTTFIQINDGVGQSYSSYHTGNSTWQWLTVTRTIDSSATTVQAYCYIITTNTSSYFDGASLVEGSSNFAFSTKPQEELGLGNTNPTNLLSNGNFEMWSSGTSVAPDNWTGGTVGGGSTTREASIIKIGFSSLKIISISGGGNYTIATQSIHAEKSIEYWKGRNVTLGCWVYLASGTSASILINDGVGESSSFIASTGFWKWIFITRIIDINATQVQVKLYVGSGGVTAYFDGAILAEGSSIFAFVEKPAVPTVQVFNSSGTWIKPNYGKIVVVRLWGGGGSGGRYASSYAEGGGGGGGYIEKIYLLSDLASTESISIGAGGAAVSSNLQGNAGGNTTFSSSTNLLTAYGGGAGGGNNNGIGGAGAGTFAVGGNASTIAVAIGGGAGGSGTAGGDATSELGGGGGAANSVSGSGGNAVYGGGGGGTASTTGTLGGSSMSGGDGGAGSIGTSANGTDGSAPGGGGGSSRGGTSGKGGDGRIIITVL